MPSSRRTRVPVARFVAVALVVKASNRPTFGPRWPRVPCVVVNHVHRHPVHATILVQRIGHRHAKPVMTV